jgi:integral membrane sensor domain MASE1
MASAISSVVQPFPGIAFIYIPQGLMPALGVWFGPWAVIGGILSGVLYSPFWGLPLHFGFISGFTDAWLALIPWVTFRALKVNPELKNIKDYLVYVIFIALITIPTEQLLFTLMGAYIFGFYPTNVIIEVTIATMPGALIGGIPLSFIFLKVLSIYIKRTPLYVK